MEPSLKKKLKGYPFVVDWDAGERYYQIHIFEDASGSNTIFISSKTNKNGKIEVFCNSSDSMESYNSLVKKAEGKAQFKETMASLERAAGKAGFSHRFIDLSQCQDPAEVAQLLAKSDPRFKIEIRHKSDVQE